MTIPELGKANERYSCFHDADLEEIDFDVAGRKLKCIISAQDETDAEHTVIIQCEDVVDFSFTSDAADDPAFSNYKFPVSRLIDNAKFSVNSRGDSLLQITGMYAWALSCCFREGSLKSAE